jgi:hypothetical protein
MELPLVDLEIAQGDASNGTTKWVTHLKYSGNIVCTWHGVEGEDGKQSGVCNARLSREKTILTLFTDDGLLKINVPEVVEGWLLGAGCPEPKGHGRTSKRRKRCQPESLESPKGKDEDQEIEGMFKLPSPCRANRATSTLRVTQLMQADEVDELEEAKAIARKAIARRWTQRILSREEDQ